MIDELKRGIVEILVEAIEANTVERWGVQHSEIDITYRFSQPDEPVWVVMPRSYNLRSRNHPPEELNTVGDHILRRRLVLKKLQRQVAEQVGVDKASIANWEGNRTKPRFEFMPAKTDTQIAIATAANSFVILELSGLPPSLQIGEKIAVRMHQGRAIIEQTPGRSR